MKRRRVLITLILCFSGISGFQVLHGVDRTHGAARNGVVCTRMDIGWNVHPDPLWTEQDIMSSGSLSLGRSGMDDDTSSPREPGPSQASKSDETAGGGSEEGLSRAADRPQQVSVWRSAGAVICILGGLLAVQAFLRKRQLFGMKAKGGKRIKIVERVQFDSRRSFVLVEADARTILVGIGPDRMEALADLGSGPGDEQGDERKEAEERPEAVFRVIGSGADG